MHNPPVTPTAALVRVILDKIGADDPVTLGNAATGESVPLTPELASTIRQLLGKLAEGRDVSITEDLKELTPNQAADLLNVSRTFVAKLLDDGTLPYRMVGTHRRIPYADLLAYREAQRVRARKAMDEISRLDREMGLDALDISPDENPLVDESRR